jgi:carbonic anhydrase
MTADEALARLKEGNARFLRDESHFLTARKDALAALELGQSPFATILGCSDSRVPVELIFDAGFGELFVVRVAGNVLSPEVMGSLQFAGAILDTSLFVVLGHEKCGAVQAALEWQLYGRSQRSRIQILVDSIVPGLPPLDYKMTEDERLSRAVEANVRWTMHQIMETPESKVRTAEGRMKLVGAVFEIATGRVRFLD